MSLFKKSIEMRYLNEIASVSMKGNFAQFKDGFL